MELLSKVNELQYTCSYICKAKELKSCNGCESYSSCVMNCALYVMLGICKKTDECISVIKEEYIESIERKD